MRFAWNAKGKAFIATLSPASMVYTWSPASGRLLLAMAWLYVRQYQIHMKI